MAKIDFYYDTKKVNEDIANWRDLEIEVNFEDEEGQGVVKSGALEFVGDLAAKINDWNSQGMYGGAGIFEAPPFRIEACGGEVIFDGGINTADCSTSYECDKVVAPLRSQNIDFLNDRASSFTFAYLYSLPANATGKIHQSDFVKVPYVINTIPNFINILTSGLSLFILLKESEEVIERTVAVIAEISGDTVMTTTSGIPPITVNVALGMFVGRLLVDIARLVLYIAYLIFIISSIISLIIMIFSNLIQPVKYKKGMRVRDMFQKASTYLGLSFSSTLLYSAKHTDDVIIPRKTGLQTNSNSVQAFFKKNFTRKDRDDNHNPKSTGFFEGTFADLILAEQQRLNAEVRIINGVLHFETKDYFANFSSYTLPNIQRRNSDPHTTNACELAANYLLSYSLDSQDTNTYDQYEGTSCQMQLAPAIVLNKRNILLKNLTEITLLYALAKRKETLTEVESAFHEIYNVADAVYSVVQAFTNTIVGVINKLLKAVASIGGGNPPQIPLMKAFPPNPLGFRIGMMLLSSDFIGVPKILSVNSSNFLRSDNAALTSAAGLIDELHFTNFAIRKINTKKEITNDHNQWRIYTDKEIPFCCDDYNALLNNNYCKTYDQLTAKIKSIIWKPDRGTARITYRVKEQYTNNLIQSYVIDGQT